MSRWWERFPDRLEAEIEALQRLEARVRRVEIPDAPGLIGLDVHFPHGGQMLPLRVVFPDLYPYFRPEVFCPQIRLARHQNPFNGGLCLIGSATHAWDYKWHVADVLNAQLGNVLQSGAADADPAGLEGIEGIHADPVSMHFNYLSASFVAFDSAWDIPAKVRSGTLDVGYQFAAINPDRPRFRGVVTRVHGEPPGAAIAQWNGPVPNSLSGRCAVRWVRSDQPIVESDPANFLRRLCELDARLRERRVYTRVDKHTFVELIGLLFPDEVQYRTPGPTWMFFLLVKKAQKNQPPRPFLIRGLRGGMTDLGSRVPGVQVLRGRKVAVFGVGALGAPVALELARNGVGELRLIDPDFVEPGPTVRWPLGFSAYGEAKPRALADFISENFPRTNIQSYDDRVGSMRTDLADPQDDRMARIFDGIDLVFDATVEVGVHHYLSDEARKMGIPYVYAFGSPGIAGGLVAHIRPDGPCWMCLQHALYERGSIPEPPADETQEIRPAGCTEPTFSGAGFDLGEVGMEAVRTIVGALPADDNVYGHGRRDVAVLALRDAAGQRCLPVWTSYDIPRREACPYCNAAPVAAA